MTTNATAALTPADVPAGHWSGVPAIENLSASLGRLGNLLVAKDHATATVGVYMVIYRAFGGVYGTMHLDEAEAREAQAELLANRKTTGYMYAKTMTVTVDDAVLMS